MGKLSTRFSLLSHKPNCNHHQHNNHQTYQVRNILLTTFLVPAPTAIVIGFLNSVALHYGSTRALPVSTVMILLTLFACVTFPLTVVGGIAGKNSSGKYDAPCKTNLAPRELPRTSWHRSQFVRILIAGTIVFSAIYIELHYIVESIWGHKIVHSFRNSCHRSYHGHTCHVVCLCSIHLLYANR